MQIMTQCVKYTPADNPNKTCNNSKRCCMWSDDCTCYEYTEKENYDASRNSDYGIRRLPEKTSND